MKRVYIFDLFGNDLTPYVTLTVVNGEYHVMNAWGKDITETCIFGVE